MNIINSVNSHFNANDAIVNSCSDFYTVDIGNLILFVRNDDGDATLEVIETFAKHLLEQCARIRAAEATEVAA